MPSFQLVGLAPESFAPLFDLSDGELAAMGARRVIADERPGFPCRVSLVDAAIGEELMLLPYAHHRVSSPYQASGPIFVRRGATRGILGAGKVPDYVSGRLISARAYDRDDMMIDAEVCEGTAVAMQLDRLFRNPKVEYVHLHNAKRGCYSCLARRA